MNPLFRFTIRCHPKRKEKFWVFVFRTQEQMDAYRKASSLIGKCAAYCHGYKMIHYPGNGKPGVVSPVIGELVFAYDALRMGIICHECVHAGVHFMQATRSKLDFRALPDMRCNQNEELFAWVVGNLARQVVLKTQKQRRRK